MNKFVRAAACVVIAAATAAAQSLPVFDSLYRRLYPPPEPVRVRAVEGLNEHIFDGKLHLTLKEFIALALRNSTDIRIARLSLLTAADAITSAKAPFDPALTMGWNAYRQVTSSYSEIQGAPTVNNLTETGNILFQQLMPTGQNVQVGFTSVRNSTNSSFVFLNPNIAGTLAFNITQPLLQNRTGLQFRAPLIARTQLLITTTEQNEAQVADIVSSAAQQYWAAIQARDFIRVEERTLELAQKSYARDKQALDLGALPKLD